MVFKLLEAAEKSCRRLDDNQFAKTRSRRDSGQPPPSDRPGRHKNWR
jgi:hypothetical protein